MDNNDRTLQAEQNLNLLQAMRTVDFWFYFLPWLVVWAQDLLQ